MSDHRQERLEEEIRVQAALFINNESNRQSLITVTRVSLSHDQRSARIFVTVLPDEAEESALVFLNRKQKEFREYFMDHVRTGIIPFMEFTIDEGEKNRQRIDSLL